VAKTKRDNAGTIAELEEIITSLISDKNEVVQIAQALEQEFVAQRISEAEIDYITTSIIPLVEHIAEASAQAGDTSAHDMIDLLTPLLSAETLTVFRESTRSLPVVHSRRLTSARQLARIEHCSILVDVGGNKR
jgi:hypothetical protein